MSRKNKSVVPRKIYPKTNISRAYYRQIINKIEHDPLVRLSTLTAASMIVAICLLLGSMIWFSQFNPGNLIHTTGRVAGISNSQANIAGSIDTFITFDFKTKEGESRSVRQLAGPGSSYEVDQSIRVGYHPDNPNYARILDQTSLSPTTIVLWAVPFLIMIWFIFVALIRYIKRQELIWEAAEAADVE